MTDSHDLSYPVTKYTGRAFLPPQIARRYKTTVQCLGPHQHEWETARLAAIRAIDDNKRVILRYGYVWQLRG